MLSCIFPRDSTGVTSYTGNLSCASQVLKTLPGKERERERLTIEQEPALIGVNLDVHPR